MQGHPSETAKAGCPTTDGRRRWRAAWRWSVGILAALVLLAGAVGWATQRVSREAPVLSLLDRMGEGSGDHRRLARQELVSRIEDAAPVLVRVVRGAKTRWQSEVMPWFDAVPAVSRMRGRNLARERNAIEALQRMGPAVAPSILVLLDEHRNGGREAAIALLRAYGPAVVPMLKSNLAQGDVDRRIGAAMALGRFRAVEQGGLGVLLTAASDRDARVRSAAVWALGEMQDAGRDVVPELVRALSDTSEGVRGQAAQALRGFGSEAAPAVGGLRALLRGSSPRLQAEAALTLSTVGEAAREAASDLLSLAESGPPVARRHSAAALVELEVHVAEGLGALRGMLQQETLATRTSAAEVVAGLGPKARALVPDLLTLLENAETADDRPAVLALRQVDPDAVPERFRRGRSGR